MNKLFISYRRDDTADACGRLNDKLAARFGQQNVFKDVDSIPLGADFRRILRDAVNQCGVMLVLIGRRWVDATDEAGRRRLENPNDFVRIEVEAALARDIPVIPVLVQGAAIPREDQLPASLAPLAYRHGVDVRGDPHFHRDVEQLMERLAPLLTAAPAQPAPPPTQQAPSAQAGASNAPQAPMRPKPATPARSGEASPFLPVRLATLGFTAHMAGDTFYILPSLCEVPAGEFLMGSDPKKDSATQNDEKPQRRVNLPSYQIGRYPVTVAEYACFVRSGQKQPNNWQQQLAKLDHPVVYVSWNDTVAYAAWLAKLTGQPWRLPSEAEWEKAARGTDGRIFPWGNQWDKARANTNDGGPKTTTPVGTYAEHGDASPYGVHDQAGNVWEWTSSLKQPYPYSANDGRESLTSTGNRVRRGGSWDYDARDARAACRGSFRPVYADDVYYGGFRVARAVPSST